MEDAIRQRVEEVFSYYSTTANKVADGDSAFQNRLSRQINQGSAISCDTILRILSAFPDVSSDWLLLGKGSMFSDNLPPMTGEEDDTTLDLHAQLAKLTAEVGELRLQNIKLQAQMEYLEEYNTRLILKLK